MNKRQFLIIEALLKSKDGMTRDEINQMFEMEGEEPFARKGFVKALATIHSKTGLNIKSHHSGMNVWRYKIDRNALEDYDREKLVGNLLANMMQAEFLLEFRELGDKIQPLTIARGTEYLRPIGIALKDNRKLSVTYQKFDDTPYNAILHPYCLKVFSGRWYLFAYKENNEHPNVQMQCFALDRILTLEVTKESFTPNKTINPKEYFRNAFGIWVDPVGHPVRDVIVACTPKVANYLRSLPLHHSQQEVDIPASDDYPHLTSHFTYHISVTPDFIGELNRWGNDCRIMD